MVSLISIRKDFFFFFPFFYRARGHDELLHNTGQKLRVTIGCLRDKEDLVEALSEDNDRATTRRQMLFIRLDWTKNNSIELLGEIQAYP